MRKDNYIKARLIEEFTKESFNEYGLENLGIIETDEKGNVIANLDAYNKFLEAHKGNSATPSVYRGTYAKYNGGSLEGMWIDMSSFMDVLEFWEFCKLLHIDEYDAELMFQDFKNFPEELYSECMDSNDIKFIIDMFEADDDDRYRVEAYIDCYGRDEKTTFEELCEHSENHCEGRGDKEELAEQLFRDCNEIPEHLENYINWEDV